MEARNNYLSEKKGTKKNKDRRRPSTTDTPCKKEKKLLRLQTITNRLTKSNDKAHKIR